MMNYKNCLYVLTNPLYAGYVKIGYASDLNSRLATLNTSMLKNFEVFCIYETQTKNADLEFHKIINDLVPILRARVINSKKIQDKEFFKLEPEQAYNILQHIAIMTNTENKLHKFDEENTDILKKSKQTNKQKSNLKKNKPNSFIIENVNYQFISWKDSLVKYCECIIEEKGMEEFEEKVLALRLTNTKTKRKIFAKTEEEMRGFCFHKFDDTELYMLTNYNAEYIRKIIEKLSEMFEIEKVKYVY